MVRSSLPVQDTTSQLVVSQILLGCVALIPSNTLRYTALAITACFSVFCIVYLKRPSLQLRRLEHDIEATEELIKGAKFQCPRDHYSLTEQEGRLLEANQCASRIKCCILNSETALSRFNCNKYSKEIAEWNKRVKRIHSTVQLILEVERQRKLADNIVQTQLILAAVYSATPINQHTRYQPEFMPSNSV